jgi:peptidoglycan/LPS O-acetylase OafA/YrhL
MRGLDGLRAIAVVAVVVYHFQPTVLPGGFFGVDLFFVISGFLITGLLVGEHDRSGGIALRSFWWRRARRLLPAVLVLIVVVVGASALVAPDALVPLRSDVPAALLYMTNWWFIFHKVSYFEAAGRPPLLLHLWSLAIEEQFYVVWPIVLGLVLPRVRSLRRVAVGTAVLALVSAALMAVMFQPGGPDPSRVYFGSDTHAQSLLVGCTLALIVPAARLVGLRGRRWVRGLDVLGALGLAAFGVLIFTLTDFGSTTYRGGFLLVSLASAACVVAAANPATWTGWVLARQPFRWVGTRSYAIYLWHWPVQQLMRAHTDLPLSGPTLFALQAVIICGAAELSYRYVEVPFRTGRAQAWLRDRYDRARFREAWIAAPGTAIVGLTLVLLGASAPAVTGPLAQGATAASRLNLAASHSTTRVPVVPRPAPATPTVPVAPGGVPLTGPPLPLGSYEPVLAIGDSVLLGCSGALEERFGPAITVDAAVGRYAYQGVQRLQAYKASGQLATYRTLVIALGTNGPMYPDQFNQLAALAAGIPNVLFVNTYAARSWEPMSNSTIAQGVAAHPGWKVVDWYDAVKADPSALLGPDGIHPRTAGIDTYTNLLISTLDPPTATRAGARPR